MIYIDPYKYPKQIMDKNVIFYVSGERLDPYAYAFFKNKASVPFKKMYFPETKNRELIVFINGDLL
jgi:hypothetical protein